MSVLQLITGRGPTGPAAAALADACALQAAGQRCVVVSANEPGISDACAGLNLEWRGGLKLGRGASRLLHVPRDIRKLRALAREFDARVVHTHRSDDQLLATAAFRGLDSVKQVRTWHRAPQRTLRLMPHAHGYVCVSRAHALTLTACGAKHAAYIPVAVDTTTFAPVERRAAAGVCVAHAGRWKRDADDRDRGQSAALNIFAALGAGGATGWRGCLAGRGEMEGALRRQAYETLRLDARQVELRNVPHTSAAEFARILASFDIGMVFTPGSDGTSRAAAEFLACGVALLVADVPGLREFAEETGAVLALPLNDSTAWVRILCELISDSARLTRMQHAARELALARHALPVRGQALVEFYSRL